MRLRLCYGVLVLNNESLALIVLSRFVRGLLVGTWSVVEAPRMLVNTDSQSAQFYW
jgi:hypothetical protein